MTADMNTTPSANAGQIRLEQRLPSYWRVTFDLPPLNIFGPKDLSPFNEIISKIENDERLKVVVFDSAVDGFFLTHWDFLAKPEDDPGMPPGATGLQPFPDMLARLSRPRLCPSPRFVAAPPDAEANSRSQATCALPVEKKPSYRNGRLALVWFRAVAPWRVSPASSVEDVH